MLRLIITLPFLILLVVFVVDNTTPGAMELPYLSWQSSPGVVALVASVAAFLLGILFMWFAELRQRRRARRAEQQVKLLEQQVGELRAQLAQSVAQGIANPGLVLHPTGTGILPPPASFAPL